MSFTVAVVLPPILDHDAEAWEGLNAAIDELTSAPSPLHELRSQLTARYPTFDMDAGAETDDPWIDVPQERHLTHRAEVIGIVSERVEEVLPVLVEMANALGCTVFDWQSGTIYRPGMPPSHSVPVHPARATPLEWLRRRIARWGRV